MTPISAYSFLTPSNNVNTMNDDLYPVVLHVLFLYISICDNLRVIFEVLFLFGRVSP